MKLAPVPTADSEPDIFMPLSSAADVPAQPSDGEGEQDPDPDLDSDPLADVFGSSPAPPPSPRQSEVAPVQPQSRSDPHHTHQQHNHPSDMPRLRAAHATAGYREGIAAAKATSVQAGFDEGFGLGAALGLRAGQLLGVLEGIAGALGGRAEAAELLGRARRELAVRAVFAEEYWNADGTWRYAVGDGAAGGEDGGDDVVFRDVVEAHPLVRKWNGIVDAEVRRWGIDLTILSASDDEAQETEGRRQPTREGESRSREPLEW